MEVKDLVLFNKEGYPINTNYNIDTDVLSSKIYFDKNSTDTYKSQAIYLFEKISGSAVDIQAYLERFQIFNTDGIYCRSNFDFQPIEITKIELSFPTTFYSTKWISGINIDRLEPGMWVYFSGIDGYASTSFDTYISGKLNIFQILAVEPGRILIKTSINNGTALAVFNGAPNKLCIPVNVIEVDQLQPNPSWNDTLDPSKIYKNKKLTMLTGSVNDSLYTVKDDVTVRTKTGYELRSTIYTPTINFGSPDVLHFEFTFSNYYIIVNNTTNVVSYEIPVVLDNNGVFSLAATYAEFANLYKDVLEFYGVKCEYIAEGDTLHLSHLYSDSYFTLVYSYTNYQGVNTVLGTTSFTYNTLPIPVNETIYQEEYLTEKVKKYSRQLIFNNIDTNGLNIVINNKSYAVLFNTDTGTTVNDWYTTYIAELDTHGIIIDIDSTYNTNDTLYIDAIYPNVNVITEMRTTQFTDYVVRYKDIQINNIKSQLLITINDKNYSVPFNTDDATTVSTWVLKHKDVLKTLGIIVNDNTNILEVSVLDPEKRLIISYNIGYIPKSGDLAIFETELAVNSVNSLIAGNEIKTTPGTYNLLNYYSSGQKITINGALKPSQNTSYNILNITTDTISLSYQGPFWQQGLPVFDLNIVSDYFIRYPKYGIEDFNNQAKLNWTWKDTQVDDFFFFDFSGNQLISYDPAFPEYNGIKPLCGPEGDIDLKLNKFPNENIDYISDPTKQQTVFDIIKYDLPYLNTVDITNEPEPLQVFIGYNSKIESYNKARLYLEFIEDISYESLTDNLNTNLWTFKDNYVEVSNVSGLDFINLGFKPNQYIEFTAIDINTDNRNVAVLNNGGIKYKIASVSMQKIIFTDTVREETSVKVIGKITPPYYDNFGNALTETRYLQIKIKVLPRVIAYFDIYGESEEEDTRYKIDLNNRNLNILKLQDFFIFKSVDIKEQGIDWIFLNRKRKELLEIYGEIFNNIGSYKSIIQAINYFGYNDLSFTEYFQNVNPESKKFGNLFNLELLNIFNKSIPGWSYSNLAFENLRNNGYRKTNLFSLNYKISDCDGNFLSAYSQEEVKIKLNGLKRWLTENLLPIGTKIVDINGKYCNTINYYINHETYMTRNFRVEEYSAPIDFDVKGYLSPINTGSDTYNITVNFKCADNIVWYDFRIRTFFLENWDNYTHYNIDNIVYYNNKVYKTDAVSYKEEPTYTTNWKETSLDILTNVQIFNDARDNDNGYSFTVNKNVDPHFLIEVNYHSGRACVHTQRKVFSVIPTFFN